MRHQHQWWVGAGLSNTHPLESDLLHTASAQEKVLQAQMPISHSFSQKTQQDHIYPHYKENPQKKVESIINKLLPTAISQEIQTETRSIRV